MQVFIHDLSKLLYERKGGCFANVPTGFCFKRMAQHTKYIYEQCHKYLRYRLVECVICMSHSKH